LGVVQGNSTAFFYVNTQGNHAKLFVNGQQQPVRQSNQSPCNQPKGTFAWSNGNKTLTYTPVAPLQMGTDYTLVLSNLASLSGNEPYVLQFSTVTPEQDAILRRYREAYAALSPEGRALVDADRLIFDGYNFVRPPTVAMSEQLSQSLTTQQAEETFQKPFDCFLKEGVDPAGVLDHGTFYQLNTVPGTSERPIRKLSASFVLPTTGGVSNQPDGQAPYVMITGKGSNLGSESSGFDVGLGWVIAGLCLPIDSWAERHN
jgi:hypothetical protein